MKITQHISATLAVSLLVACSGGGSSNSSNPQPSVSGKVVDGYLKNAQVFLDLNNNGTFDLGEPNTLTGDSGDFSLSASEAQLKSAPVIALIIAGQTIDQDQPNQPVARSFTLTSPVGYNAVVSPLTTLVAAKVAGGATLDQAVTQLKTQLGATNTDVFADYVALKSSNTSYAQLHNVATAIAVSLQNAQYISGSQGLTNVLADANTRLASEVEPRLNQIKAAGNPVDAGALVPSNSATPSSESSSSGTSTNTSTTSQATCRGVCVNVGAIK